MKRAQMLEKRAKGQMALYISLEVVVRVNHSSPQVTLC